jgi:hypothetical protein
MHLRLLQALKYNLDTPLHELAVFSLVSGEGVGAGVLLFSREERERQGQLLEASSSRALTLHVDMNGDWR